MRRCEALILLREYKRNIPMYNFKADDFSRRRKMRGSIDPKESIYASCVVDELIRRIRATNVDPIDIARDMYHSFDDVLSTQGLLPLAKWRFAAYCERAALDILNYLRERDEHYE